MKVGRLAVWPDPAWGLAWAGEKARRSARDWASASAIRAPEAAMAQRRSWFVSRILGRWKDVQNRQADFSAMTIRAADMLPYGESDEGGAQRA